MLLSTSPSLSPTPPSFLPPSSLLLLNLSSPLLANVVVADVDYVVAVIDHVAAADVSNNMISNGDDNNMVRGGDIMVRNGDDMVSGSSNMANNGANMAAVTTARSIAATMRWAGATARSVIALIG